MTTCSEKTTSEKATSRTAHLIELMTKGDDRSTNATFGVAALLSRQLGLSK
jgi:hypothetical protein